jgi:capsular exopolysaccharide synthesis family protein
LNADHTTEPVRVLNISAHPRAPRDGERFDLAEQLISLNAPDSFVADQYRGLRHIVERLRQELGIQVFAVTSPAPGDGKTVTTLNLAGSIAQSPDARVLVIDADLRRPSVAEYLGLASMRAPGLADAVEKYDVDLPRVVRSLERYNLSVLPAGSPRNSPYELLNSARIEALIKDARRQYDCILIDTPPAVPMPDCRLIERWVDGFFIVVAAHKTPKKLVAETLNVFDPAKVLGLIFNGDDEPASGYYGYYGSYYGARNGDSGIPWWRRLFHGGRRSALR